MGINREDILKGSVATLETAGGIVTPVPASAAASSSGLTTGDLVWSVASARTGAVKADGSTYDGTNATYTALWKALGSVVPQNAFVVPDLRERVPVGAGPNTALLANDGVAVANRHATRHRHTPHFHGLTVQTFVAGASTVPQLNTNVNTQTINTQNADGGSGVSTDPLDGPGYVALNPFLIL